MIVQLFFKLFVKHLLCFVGGIMFAFEGVNLIMGGSASIATPWVLMMSLVLAFVATIMDTMEKYLKALSALREHLELIEGSMDDTGKTQLIK